MSLKRDHGPVKKPNIMKSINCKGSVIWEVKCESDHMNISHEKPVYMYINRIKQNTEWEENILGR